jgi:hypothetical protein
MDRANEQWAPTTTQIVLSSVTLPKSADRKKLIWTSLMGDSPERPVWVGGGAARFLPDLFAILPGSTYALIRLANGNRRT